MGNNCAVDDQEVRRKNTGSNSVFPLLRNGLRVAAVQKISTAAKLLKKKGAQRILACVSHAILNEVGIERLRKSVIDELITTDTVLRPAISGVKIVTRSVAGLLGEAIKRIHSNSSVTSLFEFKGGRTS